MFAKIFAQIYDSSIVDSPDARFTFMDFLILADVNGVVDMTHESIARRTNRPLDLIRKTIKELEGPDPRSRTPDAQGARIFRLDDHRDWGWGIVNFDEFRLLATAEQRREKTRLRVKRFRERAKKKEDVTQCNVSLRIRNETPSASASAVLKEGVRGRFLDWVKVRKAMGRKPKNWDSMFLEQAEWLQKFSEPDQLEILSQSIRNNWQGLFPPKQKSAKPDPNQERADREYNEARKKYG